MIRRILKIAGALLGVVVLIAAAGAGWGLTHWDRTFEAPLPGLHASADSAVVARGRYLAYGPAHCVDCHVERAEAEAADRGGAMPVLAGGVEFPLPIGTFRVPNITPDSATGIGRLSDGQIARAIRYGVRHDGRAAVPFMEYQELSDDDITALISFLRSQPPVSRAVANHDLNALGKIVMAFLLKPESPKTPPPALSPAGDEPSVARGEYLVRAVASCAGCHSKRSQLDGSYIGQPMAGGGEFLDEEQHLMFVSPNLTPARAGRITGWTEEQFMARFRAGTLLPHSPMPWRALGRMTDSDVRSIYRYLKTLPPVETDPGPSMRPTT